MVDINIFSKKTQEIYKKYILSNEDLQAIDLVPISNFKGTQKSSSYICIFGKVKMSYRAVKEGKFPDIRNAFNKEEYFMKLLEYRHKNIYNSLELVSRYKKSTEKMIFKDGFGLVAVKSNSLLSGHKPNILSAIDKNDYFYNKVKFINKDLFNKNNLKIISDYKGLNNNIVVEDKYGKCEMQANSLIHGFIPSIKSAIDKTQYWKNIAKERHKNKYDYSKVKYINQNTKVTIICPMHGQFKQTPLHHTRNDSYGCTECSKKDQKGVYQVEKLIVRNKNIYKKIKSILYIIKIKDKKNKEIFYKVGITKNTTEKRIKDIPNYMFDKVILKEYKMSLYKSIKKERKLIEKLKEFKYTPDFKFGGYTECFSVNPLNYI